ncbi:Tetraspanin-11 [Eumeta japonica]|uniref:Tetraspanin-11 n=1 Tax=Eumeta variegata TaxID=151549 RepID=A0A4C1YXT2_EUMVA|nr:Tetraspanin-11 [Eumeta japonica]
MRCHQRREFVQKKLQTNLLFHKTGIHSFNRNTFTEDYFLTSFVTDRPIPELHNTEVSTDNAPGTPAEIPSTVDTAATAAFAGLGVLGVGAWTIASRHRYVSLLPTPTYAAIAYLLAVAGALAVPLCILGCCGLKTENRTSLLCNSIWDYICQQHCQGPNDPRCQMLICFGARFAGRWCDLRCPVEGLLIYVQRLFYVYTYFLLISFILECGAGGLAYYYEVAVETELRAELNNTFLHNYGLDAMISNAIDRMQTEFKCCGAVRFDDWRHSPWHDHDRRLLVPDSCCKTITNRCGARDHPSNIYYNNSRKVFDKVAPTREPRQQSVRRVPRTRPTDKAGNSSRGTRRSLKRLPCPLHPANEKKDRDVPIATISDNLSI